MRFSLLRIDGFKSFAHPVELPLLPGLTGVVGPNGSGKSNITEALRWVSRSSTARALRAPDTAGIIYGTRTGSTGGNRPPRAAATVELVVDEVPERVAAEYGTRQLTIARRAVRGAGGATTAYRVNGEEALARDVGILFADWGLGPNSPAFVTQSQVAALVDQGPRERRLILDAAAGIAGLKDRKREAERSLDLAERNVDRHRDLIAELEQQARALESAALRAGRHAAVVAQIRSLSAMRAAVMLEVAQLEASRLAASADQSTAALSQATLAVDLAATAVAEAGVSAAIAEGLATTATRQAEESASRVDEERRVLVSLSERHDRVDGRLDRARADAERAAATIATADEQVLCLSAAPKRPGDRGEPATRIDLENAQAEERSAMSALERARASLRDVMRQGRAAAEDRARLTADEARLERQLRDLTSLEGVEGDALREMERHAERAGERLAQARQEHRAASEASANARAELEVAERSLRKAQDAERHAATHPRRFVQDSVRIDPGAELAVAVAFADELEHGTVPGDEPWWMTVPNAAVGPLPRGANPLSALVTAPPALERALAAVGVVPANDGRRLAQDLRPGQRLVSLEGDLWRWDGLVVPRRARPASAAEAAVRTAQSARIAVREAEADRRSAAGADSAARISHEGARTKLDQAERQRDLARQTFQAAQLARAEHDRSREEAVALAAELASVRDRLAQLNAVEALPIAEFEVAATEAERHLEATRTRAFELARDVAAAEASEQVDRTRRDQLEAWTRQLEEARRQHAEVAGDIETAEAERQRLTAEHEAAAERVAKLAEVAQTAAQSAVHYGQLNRAAAAALETAELVHSEARDVRADRRVEVERLRARADAAADRVAELRQAASSDFGMDHPTGLRDLATELAEGSVPDQDPHELTARIAQLSREKARLEPVNEEAAADLTRVSERLDDQVARRDEFAAAMKTMRRALGTLDRDAAAAVREAAEAMDANFRFLFSLLFGPTGSAQLTLDDDDPLEAGLEVRVGLPGKPQVPLSVLSGGEKSLVAVALALAAFLTRPAPVCILDEADAALDAANTARFCDMLRAVAKHSNACFLVVTHHPMTKARMDRLFAVAVDRGATKVRAIALPQGSDASRARRATSG